MRLIVLVLSAAVAAVDVVGEVGAPSRDERALGRAERSCVTPAGVASISFSSTRYPTVRRHFETAVARG